MDGIQGAQFTPQAKSVVENARSMSSNDLISRINRLIFSKGFLVTSMASVLVGGFLLWKTVDWKKNTPSNLLPLPFKKRIDDKQELSNISKAVQEEANSIYNDDLKKDILRTIKLIEDAAQDMISQTRNKKIISNIRKSAIFELNFLSCEIKQLQQNPQEADPCPEDSPEAMEWCRKLRETLQYPWNKVQFRELIQLGKQRGYLNHSYTAISVIGGTILHAITKRPNANLLPYIPILKEAEVDFAVKDNDGNTALLWAIANACNTTAWTLLMSAGPGPYLDVQGLMKNTALHLAIGKGYRHVSADNQKLEYTNFEIAKLIIQFGGSLLAQNENGDTPLHLACVRRDAKAIRLLMESRKDLLNIKNSEDKTPSEMLHMGYPVAKSYLEKTVSVLLLDEKEYHLSLNRCLLALRK